MKGLMGLGTVNGFQNSHGYPGENDGKTSIERGFPLKKRAYDVSYPIVSKNFGRQS